MSKKSFLAIAILFQTFLHSAKTQEIPDSLRWLMEKSVRVTGHPILGYTPETRWAFGAASVLYFRTGEGFKRNEKVSTINPFFFFTQKKQFWFVTKADLHYARTISNLRLEAGKVPDYFYGIGNNTDDQRERYTLKTYGLHWKQLLKTRDFLFLGIHAHANRNYLRGFAENSLLVEDNIDGLADGFILGLGPSFRMDKRDHIINPVTGWYFDTDFSVFPGGLEGDYQFMRYTFDFRKYVTTADKINTLAFQVQGNFSSGKKIPFYELSRLGGEPRARGISANRYMDRNMIFSQMEYRLKLPLIFGLVGFVGAGQVFPEFNAFNGKNFKYIAGLGLRMLVIEEERTNFRFDVGFGPQGEHHFYVGIQEVF